MPTIDELLARVVTWAKARGDVLGVALVGSHARGTAREDSDLDVVLVVESMEPYLQDDAWLLAFGELDSLADEDYGLVQSRRAVYHGGLELEWALADERWLRVPPDPGTAEVVADGMRILYDPSDRIAALQHAAGSARPDRGRP
ncbi:MAG: aminoglycoside 6-adenylyltransferase [Myxococcales bacterium]|nr:aminoglycoside 6-adenylyltransferase [Myxococcales bacterium]MCB9717533.1 aminoglycoside 6-adenylyltransferase [Myxococcales bacterium]